MPCLYYKIFNVINTSKILIKAKDLLITYKIVEVRSHMFYRKSICQIFDQRILSQDLIKKVKVIENNDRYVINHTLNNSFLLTHTLTHSTIRSNAYSLIQYMLTHLRASSFIPLFATCPLTQILVWLLAHSF